MIIFPYSTDAPIYHFPKATLALIIANVGIHFAWPPATSAAVEPYAMILGDGLHPLQWLSHNFLHADFLHLGFNMIFLWCYGIIVEGKIGWLPFLIVYLGIGTAHGAAIQTAYLGAAEPSYVLGASAIIFGLMAIAMIWAPVNELSCLYIFILVFRIFTGQFDVRIFVFAILQLFLEGASILFKYLMHGDPMSSALLHVSGAIWGLLVGILILKAGWVDCEGWDVFSLLTKKRGLRDAWREREARLDLAKQSEKLPRTALLDNGAPGASAEERSTRLLNKTHRAIEAGDILTAQATYEKWANTLTSVPPREVLLGIISDFHGRQQWAASVPPMRALCKHYPDRSSKARLKLAGILMRELNRPTEALRHLEKLQPASLDPTLRNMHHTLLTHARKMIDEGVLEVEEEV